MIEKMNYRIGLDIGIASVGWAVILNDSMDNPAHIVDMGVRIFDKAENPKDGKALAAPRRESRCARRRNGRRKHRINRVKYLLACSGVIDPEQFEKRYHSANLPNVYELRYEALNRIITNDELAQILVYMAKHRGFKSNRKAELKDEETGKLLKAISSNQALMVNKGYRTVGEMLFKDPSFRARAEWSSAGEFLVVRNTTGNYKNSIMRDMLVEEVKKIFEAQRSFGNLAASEKLQEEYLKIMESQRSFDLGPGNQSDGTPSPYALNGFGESVGYCTFEKNERRAPKASYSAELFNVLQKINNTRIVDKDGEIRTLSAEERDLLLELSHKQKEISYHSARVKLGLDDTCRFKALNYRRKNKASKSIVEDTEKSVFLRLQYYHEFRKSLGGDPFNNEEDCKIYDEVARILCEYKNDDSRIEELAKLGVSSVVIDDLLELTPSKYLHLSIKAIKKIMPYLKNGLTYDKACLEAGYDFKAEMSEKTRLLKGEVIIEEINNITNPVVRRAVSQSIKVLNAIILKYGSPQAVHIELAREMSKNFLERNKIQKSIEERAADNERVKNYLMNELGIKNPNGQDIIMYRLWNEQKGICPYSGRKITLEDLINRCCEVDHILPYSRTFDDSYHNKVLVFKEENQNKSNRIPYEYLGKNPDRWADFEARVEMCTDDYIKKQHFLKKKLSQEEEREFIERNLQDTKFISRFMFNLIKNHLKVSEWNTEKKKHVMAVNGAVTAYLRKRWGLPLKNRATDIHHAVDAVVIACTTDHMIHVISRYMKAREMAYVKGIQIVDEETGEVFNRDDFTKKEWDEKFGVKIPLPWECFRDEVDIRLGENPLRFLEEHVDVARKLNYPEYFYSKEILHPIFISRMPRRKVTGSVHDATLRSAKIIDRGYSLSKTPIETLKLDKNGEIDGYFEEARKSDEVLYQALKVQLENHGGKGSEAFKKEFHKPKADGTPGPVVKKVWIQSKQTSGVLLNGGKAIANNGDMVRIDVFRHDGKYYFVPIYVADTVKTVLPIRAATQRKSIDNWRMMDEADYAFSLYPNDLIHIIDNKGITVTETTTNSKYKVQEIFGYFSGADISTASIQFNSHDKALSARGVGIQNITRLEKCQVDVLGNISFVKKEKRMGFRKKENKHGLS